LVKEGDTEEDSARQVLVCLREVFLVFGAVKQEELEGRLPISSLVCLLEEHLSLVKILLHAVGLHMEDSHPVLSDQTSLLSTTSIEECRFRRFVAFIALGVG